MSSLPKLRKKAVALSDQSWDTIWEEDGAVIWVSIPKNVNGNVQVLGKGKDRCLFFKWAGNVWVKIVGNVSLDLCGTRIAGIPSLVKSSDDSLAQCSVRYLPGTVSRTRLVTYNTLFEEYRPAPDDVTRSFGAGIFVIRDAVKLN